MAASLGSKESAYLFFNNGVIFAPGVFIFSEELTFFLLENSPLTMVSLSAFRWGVNFKPLRLDVGMIDRYAIISSRFRQLSG